MDQRAPIPCAHCGETHPADACEAMRRATTAGAQPPGVPVRVYGGYLEARSALRANAPAMAVRVLQWLLAHVAQEQGVSPKLDLAAKVAALSERGVISASLRTSLVDRALSPEPSAETAWALMSLVEHALARLYLRKSA